MTLLSIGEVAKKLHVSRDSIHAALRKGAPEPRTSRIGGRRVFSDADYAAIAEWYARRWAIRDGFLPRPGKEDLRNL
ncbi:MAG: MerR family transcriptional regulator [Planctomycetota bacterium]|jgi:predicted DNA-binding transcriptional regulator AlpA|nr:MerR family transcriptional regulator [Planctomycetota bacterium]